MPAVKIDVFASAGEVVKAFNGFRQRIGVDGALLRQLPSVFPRSR